MTCVVGEAFDGINSMQMSFARGNPRTGAASECASHLINTLIYRCVRASEGVQASQHFHKLKKTVEANQLIASRSAPNIFFSRRHLSPLWLRSFGHRSRSRASPNTEKMISIPPDFFTKKLFTVVNNLSKTFSISVFF